jgi:hypothetical protein
LTPEAGLIDITSYSYQVISRHSRRDYDEKGFLEKNVQQKGRGRSNRGGPGGLFGGLYSDGSVVDSWLPKSFGREGTEKGSGDP